MADLFGEPSLPVHDRAPLLPRGVTVFEDLPVRALVLDRLAPAIDAGALRVSAPHATAVLVIRAGAVAAAHLFTEHERHSGSWVQRQIGSWSDGVVTAERFDDVQLEVTDALLHGGVVYDDLRLDWTDWGQLVADLQRRGGAYVLELDTAAGRGVTCIAGGRQTLAYTDVDPTSGEAVMLEALALSSTGRVRVRRMNAAPLSRSSLTDELDRARPEAPPPPPVDAPEPGAELPPLEPWVDAESPPVTEAVDDPPASWPDTRGDGDNRSDAAGQWPEGTAEAPLGELVASVAADAEVTRSIGILLPDVPWVAPWDTDWARPGADEPSADNGHGRRELAAHAGDPPTVGLVRDELQAIARRYLKMSSSRVEAALDAAAAQELPVDHVLDDLRGISIRGVMPQTIDTMIDDMAALARVRQG